MLFANSKLSAKVDALDRSQAVIEFQVDGTIISANANFLSVMGYEPQEIVGQHHRMFVDPAERDSTAYKAFWASLAQGEYKRAEYRRFGKGGNELWLQATYTPILGRNGRPTRIVKFATDITADKRRNANHEGQVAAINRSQGIIEFSLDGTILDANENFLAVVGYGHAEIVGQHHRMFVDPEERAGAAYAAFWDALRRGEFQAAEYRRVGKGGREVWIQASYNPILDPAGRPIKIVKFATDITADKRRNADHGGKVAAIGRSQGIIEFSLDGTILDANKNFLAVVGYGHAEIVGQHHRMFVDPEERAGVAYAAFWDALRRGEFQAAEYRRVGKGGREVWIQASYNPILDPAGRPIKIVKFATDVTHRKMSQIKASTASSQTLTNVQSAASAAEELSASIREIAGNLARSRALVDDIHGQAQAADGSTARLNAAAASMTGLVQLIQAVGRQINLLALNATIEAARAGESGRGFAVVASEVKSLSDQITSATSRISGDIETMQAVVGEVVGSLDAIGQSIASVRGVVINVAASVEEQSTVTDHISENMQTAARGVTDVNQNLLALAS